MSMTIYPHTRSRMRRGISWKTYINSTSCIWPCRNKLKPSVDSARRLLGHGQPKHMQSYTEKKEEEDQNSVCRLLIGDGEMPDLHSIGQCDIPTGSMAEHVQGTEGIDYVLHSNGTDRYEILTYLQARKRIYFPIYRQLVREHPAYTQLTHEHQHRALQIVEVDGPSYASHFPFNQVVNGSLLMTPEIGQALVNDSSQNFGHGYCLALCLLFDKGDSTFPL